MSADVVGLHGVLEWILTGGRNDLLASERDGSELKTAELQVVGSSWSVMTTRWAGAEAVGSFSNVMV